MNKDDVALTTKGGPPPRISLAEALVRVRSEPMPYALLFDHGDVAVEFFVPRGHDMQTPHAQTSFTLSSPVQRNSCGGKNASAAPPAIRFTCQR